MKKILLLTILNSLLFLDLNAQSTVVRNIKLYYKNEQAIINYDLKEFGKSKFHHTQLLFVDDNFNVRVPQKITGDFGDSISAGKSKEIQWSLFEDKVDISNTLRPIILVDEFTKGGSGNVFYSLLIPGLGDYFVENPRDMVFKPYLRTLTALGALTLGYIADQNRVKLVWKKWDNRTNKELGWLYDNDYWLFSFDKELFYFIGISIWLYDVIWVYSKGNENERLSIFSDYSPVFSLENGVASFGVRVGL